MQYLWIPAINAADSILRTFYYVIMIITAFKLIKALDKYNKKN